MRLPKGEWITSCMPPASSKKRSSTIVSCVGRQPSAAWRGGEIFDELLARRPRRGRPPPCSQLDGALAARIGRDALRDLGAQPRHRRRQLVGAARRLAEPERDGRRLPVRVLHAHDAALDPQDAVATCCRAGRCRRPGSRPRSPRSPCRRSGSPAPAAPGSRRCPGSCRRRSCAVSRAPRRPRSMPFTASWWMSAPRRPRRVLKPSASMRDDRREVLARQRRGRARRGGSSAKSSSSFHSCAATSATICCASTSSGCSGMIEPVELAAAHAVEQRRAFDQLVAREREQPALGRAVDRMAGAADALQEGRDRARRAELADQVDVADVDAELERGGRHQRLELAALEPLLGVEPLLLGEAAVVRGHAAPRRAAREAGGSRARPCGAC